MKQKSGLGTGIDGKGTLAVIFLPPQGEKKEPVVVGLLPITDYAQFLKPLKPEDASAEITKIELGGHEAWVRKLGGYAVSVDSPYRDVLAGLTVAAEPRSDLAPLGKWLSRADAAGVIRKPGIAIVSAKAQEGIRQMKAFMSALGDQGKAAAAMYDVYAQAFQYAEQEADIAGIGLRLDPKNGSLHLTMVLRPITGGSLAAWTEDFRPVRENLFSGLPTGPFALAAGGTFSKDSFDRLMRMSLGMIKSMPQVYGLKPEQVDELTESSKGMMKGVHGMSFLMGVPGKGQPMYSKTVALMRVDDSDAFLQSYQEQLHRYSAVLEKIDSPMLRPMEMEKTEVGKTAGWKLTMEMPQLPRARRARHDEDHGRHVRSRGQDDRLPRPGQPAHGRVRLREQGHGGAGHRDRAKGRAGTCQGGGRGRNRRSSRPRRPACPFP